MPGPTQEEKGDEIVRKINARVSPLAIDFSVDACKNVPTNQIAPTNAMSFSESLITEVFRETGIPNDEATQGCLNLMAERIMPRKLLQITMLQHHTKWSSVVQKLDIMKVVRGATGMPMCMSAPDLALIIVAVLFRKIQPERLKSLTNKSDFVEFFGHLNGMQWLPIAIRVNELVGDRVFAIELDQNVTIPKVRREKINGRRVAIVTTKKPQTNIYEAAMQAVTGRMIKGDIDISKSPDPETNNQPRQSTEMDESYSTGQPRESIETDEPDSSLPDQSEAIEMCDGSQIASDESGSASKEPIGKFETNDIPLRSIAPSSIKERSPDLESQQGGDPETEPNLQLNSDTIRDHARQMKVLGKRLPSPDQKFVRRVRRDMRRFANLADERENEMAHNHPSVPSRPSSTSEHSQASSIDLFGRYKMLRKGALRESGSIPESLRELVRHDCDPNQLFYLEETEADFLAANAMRNENGQ